MLTLIGILLAFFVGFSLRNEVTWFLRSFEPPHFVGRIYRDEDTFLYYYVLLLLFALGYWVNALSLFAYFDPDSLITGTGDSVVAYKGFSFSTQLLVYTFAGLITVISVFLGFRWKVYLPDIQTRFVRRSDSRQKTFLFNVLGMFAEFSKIDKHISSQEEERVEHYIRNSLGLGDAQLGDTLRMWQERKHSSITFEIYALNLYGAFASSRGMLRSVVHMLIEIGNSDGKMGSAEERLIHKARRIFRFSEAEFQRVVASQTTTGPHAVLGCKPGDSQRVIKRRYRMLVKQLHPDALRAQGMSEEFIAQAREKFFKVQKAYEALTNN